MADVQVENGYCRIANEIFEQMARIKLSPTQYRILFVVWRFTYGFNRKEHELALSFISNATGCDKRQLQRELKGLADKRIITQKVITGISRTISFNKNYEEWIGGIAIGEIDNGETTNGEIDNGSFDNGYLTTGGETDNPTIGETVKGGIGEIDNQERQSLKTILNTVDVVVERDAVPDLENDIAKKANEIEIYFCQKRRRGVQVSIEDYALIKKVIAFGVTVESIKQSIDCIFAEYKPKHPKDEIRSFSYCEPRCYDDWLRYLEKQKPVSKGGDQNGKQGDPRSPTSSDGSKPESLSAQFTKKE